MSTSLTTIGNNISSSFGAFGDYCVNTYNEAKLNLSQYFESKDFEKDLDLIIEALYVHTKKRPDFDSVESFNDRIGLKKDFLINQAGKFVIGGALSGAWAAIKTGNIPMTGEYMLVGASGAAVIIVVTVTGVVVKE